MRRVLLKREICISVGHEGEKEMEEVPSAKGE